MKRRDGQKKTRIVLTFVFLSFLVAACLMILLATDLSSALESLRAAIIFFILILLAYNLEKVTAFLDKKK